MAQCQILNLTQNQIGDKGLAAFAEALAKGVLATLKTLVITRPPRYIER